MRSQRLARLALDPRVPPQQRTRSHPFPRSLLQMVVLGGRVRRGSECFDVCGESPPPPAFWKRPCGHTWGRSLAKLLDH
eukprot:9488036-Pyramimonas_sp.AAC.1